MRLPAREGNRPEICSGRQKKLQPHEHKGCKFSHFFHNGNRNFRLLESKCLTKIINKVIDILCPDRKPQHVWIDSGGNLL